MRENHLDQVVYRSTTVVKASFTANSTTDVFTSSSHGLVNGDKLWVSNSGGALPTGLTASTNYYVINVTTDTFQLSSIPGGPVVNITDAGSGTNSINVKGRAIYIGDSKYAAISIAFSNTPTMTVKFQGALTDSDSAPDFASSSSETNRWDYIMVFDLQQETGAGGESGIAGDTGVSCSGSADVTQYRINTNGLSWISADITAFTAGNVDIRVSSYQ